MTEFVAEPARECRRSKHAAADAEEPRIEVLEGAAADEHGVQPGTLADRLIAEGRKAEGCSIGDHHVSSFVCPGADHLGEEVDRSGDDRCPGGEPGGRGRIGGHRSREISHLNDFRQNLERNVVAGAGERVPFAPEGIVKWTKADCRSGVDYLAAGEPGDDIGLRAEE